MPQGVSQMHEAYAILMDRFYGDFKAIRIIVWKSQSDKPLIKMEEHYD